MVGVDEAREAILAAFAPLPAITLPILDALGMVLAEEVVAGVAIPPFPNSAMDGFAVRAIDTIGASFETPIRLRVIGEAPAGYESRACVGPSTAVRIMTGAPVPEGADAVVRFEETDEVERPGEHNGHVADAVGIRRAAKPGDN
ncbi:MAG: molybdopterin molybdenumtransferase MoeA, partial [Chloroflexia bacterium]|nr:molybdopterin molybdenumtransferase MoeA [Chloroflexia bacterium]